MNMGMNTNVIEDINNNLNERYNLPDLIFCFDSEFDDDTYTYDIESLSIDTFNINSKCSDKYVCKCTCDCRNRNGFFTLAPYKIGHSLINKKIHVCQHFASCKFSGKTCRK